LAENPINWAGGVDEATLFWRSAAVGAAAYFIAARVPFLHAPLELAALGWTGYWYAARSGRNGTWLHALGAGALAGVAGSLLATLVYALGTVLFHPLLTLLELATSPFRLAFVAVEGAVCAGIGWALARRGGRAPWQRWDRGG
jgi:hypothetical protein